MENIFNKIEEKTQNQDIKKIIQSLSDPNLQPDEMELNLIKDNFFIN